MKTIEEQKIEAIRDVFEKWDVSFLHLKTGRVIGRMPLAEDILESLKQFEPEQLEVDANSVMYKDLQGECKVKDIFEFRREFLDHSEALEFCKKYNLKVVGVMMYRK